MPLPRGPAALPLLLASFALAWPREARAYRPFDGTDADVAGAGEFELELGPVHFYGQGGTHYLVAPATVLNLGLWPGLELVADFQNFVGVDPAPGEARDRLLDTDVLLKAVLVRGSLQGAGRGPSVAAEAGLLLPNVAGERGLGASCDVIVSERWPSLTLHVNSWVELTRGDLRPTWFEGVIVEGPFEAPARPVGEVFVEREFAAGVTTWSALVGGIWRARDGLDLDVGLREARVGSQAAAEVRMGLTWTLEVWRP
jgi:hypothetical protein